MKFCTPSLPLSNLRLFVTTNLNNIRTVIMLIIVLIHSSTTAVVFTIMLVMKSVHTKEIDQDIHTSKKHFGSNSKLMV